jgi:chorismate synthase
MPAHDTLTINAARRSCDYIGNAAERLTADASGISANMGFIPSVSGFARVKTGLGTALVDIPTVAGIHVGIDIQQFDKTNSTASQELVIIRQGGGAT